jgi:hypothetical protein
MPLQSNRKEFFDYSGASVFSIYAKSKHYQEVTRKTMAFSRVKSNIVQYIL